MEFDEKALYDHVIGEYQQALSGAQFNLARANAQSAQKDHRIAELTRQLESARAPSGPKPGPPPAH